MLTPFLVIGCLLAGAPASDAALKTEVQILVHKLDADTEKERKEAKEGLLNLGPAALDLLPAPDPQATGEPANSIREIRQKLQAIQAARSVEASTVTLHGRLKLSQVLAEIHRQTGNTIAEGPRPAEAAVPDAEITVNFDKTPFWTALDSALDQAQLSIYPYGQPGALQIRPRGPHDLPRTGRAAISGPLRIEPVSVLAKRELRSSSPPSLQISLEVAWEPRLQPIGIKQRMADLKVLDSNGASLAAENPQAVIDPFLRLGVSALEMDIALAMPAPPVKEIASLKGTLRAMILGKVETFKFGDLLKGKQEKRIAAATVAVDEVRKNGDSWEVFVRLRFDNAGDALDSYLSNWVQQNEAYLEDANGKHIQPDSTESTLRNKNEIGVGYVFALPDLPKNAVFVYKTAGMVVTKDFPYEVRGVKMP